MSERTATDPRDDQAAVLAVSPPALQKVKAIRDGEPDGDALALWLQVVGAAGGEYTYDIFFERPERAEPGDAVQQVDDLTVVVPASSVERLRGATLGMSRDLLNPGMAVTNPNKPPAPPAPTPTLALDAQPSDFTGSVAERIGQVLERHVNPGIAAHGGRAELAGVEGEIAYLELSGGCQGCGQAQVTLRQGIEVAIKQLVPEITDVRDVTDHAAGENPYYEPAH
jgi:Fe/S biogenesis protein NfuA